ncbi:S8 family serine peptidase [Simiduia sp. 21SJ11W-1]|uniref:S8 family serine peptidase n=1 Tax=Simiduia sp. 21SJ11W-1 TaxID=2909669 RepID=UPI00209CC553|nr:S8 family serine peptidase [Simiduia sp. 21SJ11W-1]UTA48748.1 S8 family serine peptidase [Simiduia sp. 21SJ11W-1]
MNVKRTACAASLLTAALLSWQAQAQLVNTEAVTTPLEPLGAPAGLVRERLDQAAEAARDRARIAEAQAREAALDPVTRALANPLAKLPGALPIMGADGTPAFEEVTVEDGWRAVAREWLVWLPDGEQASLVQAGIAELSRQALPALGLTVVRIQVSAELDNRQALEALLPAATHAGLDRNHTYASQRAPSQDLEPATAAPGFQCPVAARVGMVDTAVQADHPAFESVAITHQNFLPEGLAEPLAQQQAHGTAVAGLLVGRRPEGSTQAQARLPGSQLYAASAFYGRSDYSQGATTQSLLQALNWLASERVVAINLSLAGPPNKLLAAAIAGISRQQIAVVAAVGNEGPASPPLYPAAFPGVVGVTAIDQQQAVYRWANQGEQVDFAALGVSVATARAMSSQQTRPWGHETGTSMAAPLVTARLACALAEGKSLAQALDDLQQAAVDLGMPGRDPVFGVGWVQ